MSKNQRETSNMSKNDQNYRQKYLKTVNMSKNLEKSVNNIQRTTKMLKNLEPSKMPENGKRA